MAIGLSKRQGLLIASAIVSLGMIGMEFVLLNFVGELAEGWGVLFDWWVLSVGLSLYVFGGIAIGSLVWLLVDSIRTLAKAKSARNEASKTSAG